MRRWFLLVSWNRLDPSAAFIRVLWEEVEWKDKGGSLELPASAAAPGEGAGKFSPLASVDESPEEPVFAASAAVGA